MKPTRFQAQIMEYLYDLLPIVDPAGISEFSLDGSMEGNKHLIVTCEMNNIGETERLVLNLPTRSGTVFIAFVGDHINDALLVLANLEDYEQKAGLSVRLGEVVVLPNDFLKGGHSHFLHAVILLRVSVASALVSLPDCHSVEDGHVSFALVLPLSEEEYSCLKLSGHDALMDHFEEHGKSLNLF